MIGAAPFFFLSSSSTHKFWEYKLPTLPYLEVYLRSWTNHIIGTYLVFHVITSPIRLT